MKIFQTYEELKLKCGQDIFNALKVIQFFFHIICDGKTDFVSITRENLHNAWMQMRYQNIR